LDKGEPEPESRADCRCLVSTSKQRNSACSRVATIESYNKNNAILVFIGCLPWPRVTTNLNLYTILLLPIVVSQQRNSACSRLATNESYNNHHNNNNILLHIECLP